jgi:16S rRNA (cytosine1407-C5)-methyltransferase
MGKTKPVTYNFDWLAAANPDLYARVQEVSQQPLDISIRINRLKADPQDAIRNWACLYQWEYEDVPFCSSGFRITKSAIAPSSTIEHRLGYYYIQETASMLPVELFDLEELPASLILDMAASPGGKTIHLVDRSRDKGFIVANDASRGRISALRIVLQNWGAINQAITCLPGELIGSVYPEQFDAVLLDAPCSMQGLRASESHKARSITETEVDALAARQIRLLESALQTAKVGGQVVYSTCTLTPQEDEGVLAALLARYPGLFEIRDVSQRLPQPAPGLAAFGDHAFPKEIQRAARLWPHIFGTAGFFAAKLVKTGSLPGMDEIRLPRSGKTRDIKIPLASENGAMIDYLAESYGFDLPAIVDEQALLVVEINGQLTLIGKPLLSVFPDLPWLSSGMPLGKALPEGWQPSHEFVSRFGDRFTQRALTLGDELLPAWQRGEDLRGYSASPDLRGQVVVARDKLGRNLGRAKVLEDRLKNLLPTRIF